MTMPEVPRAGNIYNGGYFVINEKGDVEQKSAHEGMNWRKLGSALGLCESVDLYCARQTDAAYQKIMESPNMLYQTKVMDFQGNLIDRNLYVEEIDYLVNCHLALHSVEKKVDAAASIVLVQNPIKEGYEGPRLLNAVMGSSKRSKEQFAHFLTLVSNVNEHDSDVGTTPLGLALKNDNKEAAELLLKHPLIDVNAQDEKGRTPLMLACLSQNPLESIRLLVEGAKKAGQKIEWEITDKQGYTALLQVISNRSIQDKEKIIAYLLENGAIDPLPPIKEMPIFPQGSL